MGTGGRFARPGRGRPAAPVLAGLPHRRYSVPETIMRKYKLTKQHSESGSDGAVTVPNLTPENMSAANNRYGVGNGSTPRGGKTPPLNRRRKTGRGFEDNIFGRQARTNGQHRTRKGPPMYKGGQGNLESPSSEESDDKILEASLNDSVESSSEEIIKSPECLECKNFLLEVITEESEKSASKESISPKFKVKESSDISPAKPGRRYGFSAMKSPKHPQNNEDDQEDARVAAILINADEDSPKNKLPDPIDSPGPSSLPIEEIEDGYKPFLTVKMKSSASRSNSPRISPEHLNRLLTPDDEQNSPGNSARFSPSTPNPPKSHTPKLHQESESSIEKTSGFSDQTTPEDRGDTSPREGDDLTPRRGDEEASSSSYRAIPRLNLGSRSCSLTSTSTPPSSERPSGGSSLLNDRTSSITLYQPNTDRSSSTQDSTMSIPSDSLPRSRGISTSPRDDDNVMTQSKQTQCDEENQRLETTATNTDTPVTMTTTATNTEQCGCPELRDPGQGPSNRPQDASQSGDEAESQGLPIQDDDELKEKAAISRKSYVVSRETGIPKESNLSDNSSRYFHLKHQDLNKTYPINRPFSMSKSTAEKYVNAAISSNSSSVDPSRSELVFSSESQLTEENNFCSEQLDEDEYTKLTHHRQRFWMSKKSENSLPATPADGALSSIGTGTVYRKDSIESQLVVPRYSALPRTVSMLVNTSSQDCSSNSSDSECLSLVDSLDDVPISPRHFDVVELLPEGQRTGAPALREKPTAFFVTIDDATDVISSSPVVAGLLPEKLEKRLSSRRQEINIKRQQQADAREQKEKEAKEREVKEQKARIAKARRELRAKKADKKLVNEKSKSKENSPREGNSVTDEKQSPRNISQSKSQKSSIPVMKSASDLQKLVKSPRNNQSSSQNPSHLPVRRRHQSPPVVRRSANLLMNRFRQRFEVIPEERGSLESSTDDLRLLDRTRSYSLPTSKLTSQSDNENSSSPRDSNGVRTKRMSLGSKPIVLKTPGPLIESVTIHEVVEEPVKDCYKGRAALAPHTDEGMSSLSKGWINFYLLKDNGKSSPETSGNDGGNQCSPPPQKTVNVVGGSGSHVRNYTVPYHSSVETKLSQSVPILPELKPLVTSIKQSLVTEERQYDSNSSEGKRIMAYLHLPSPRVQPPHLYEGSVTQASSESSSVTSSDEETEKSISPAMLPVRWPIRQQQRRLPRSKSQHYRPEAGQYQKQSSANHGGVGWTVTVAGNNNQSQPDVEMRLTFPPNTRQPHNSQSDSGLGEDNNNTTTNNNNNADNKSNQGENRTTKKHFLPPATTTQGQQRWTLTVKNGPERVLQDFQRADKNLFQCLPELPLQQGHTKSSKKANKGMTLPATTFGDIYPNQMRDLSAIWPRDEGLITTKVIIRKTTARYSREVRSVSQLLADNEEGLILRSGLTVTGSAISPEKKPRVQTMSEKDLTRSQTARR